MQTHHFTLTIGQEQEANRPEIAYVIACVNEHPNTKSVGAIWSLDPSESARTLHYGVGTDAQIKAQNLIFSEYQVNYSLLVANEYLHNNQVIWSVEREKRRKTAFFDQKDAQNSVFNFDWIEMLFFHISRIEEYHTLDTDRDTYGNATTQSLFLPRQNLHHTPVVDQLIVALYEALGITVSSQKTTWSMTHDADHAHFFSSPMRFFKFLAGTVIHPRRLRHWPNITKAYLNHQDPYHTYQQMLVNEAIEKVLYLPSGLYQHKLDPTIQLTDPQTDTLIKLAKALGYQIGLHPRLYSGSDLEVWNSEQSTIEQYLGEKVNYTRQHFLHFQFPATCEILEQSGIKHDSSLGYRDLIGFRSGTGFAHKLFRFSTRTAYTWREIPLVIMDIALMREGKMDTKTILNILTHFTESNQLHTRITVLFHNSIFFEAQLYGTEMESAYTEIVRQISHHLPTKM
jgi:hypothetical protein